MTDVLKIAFDKRAKLVEELAQIDGFIRMAKKLLNEQVPRAEQAEQTERPSRAEPPQQEPSGMPGMPFRPASVLDGTAAADAEDVRRQVIRRSQVSTGG